MNRKIILPISLALLVGLAVFVSALRMEKDISGYGTVGGDYQQASAKVTNGWNLIKGFPTPEWIFDGDVSKNNIKAIYALNPLTKEYIRFYPENKDLSELDITIDYLVGITAFWVYIDGMEEETGELEYYTLESSPLNQKQLVKGWNFVGITSDMYYGTYDSAGTSETYKGGYFALETIKGDCDILKSYYWDNKNQEWIEWSLDLDIKSYDFEKILNKGLTIKVSNDKCSLRTTTGVGSVTPPSIPN